MAERIIASGKLQEAGYTFVKMAVLVIICLVVLKIVLRITRKTLAKSSFDPVLYSFIINAIKVVSIIIIITMCLGIIGVQMSTIVAVIGAAGAAIALALRDSLANIAGGVMIIITQPFKRDDFIDVGEVSGKVKEIDLFLTTLMTYDNKTITIPNGTINTSILINHSREGVRRVDCQFSIGYDSDIEKVKDVMSVVCGRNPMILREPAPIMGISEHGESAMLMDLKVWCRTDDYWTVKYYLEENIKVEFDKNGVEIPYRKLDIRVDMDGYGCRDGKKKGTSDDYT